MKETNEKGLSLVNFHIIEVAASCSNNNNKCTEMFTMCETQTHNKLFRLKNDVRYKK